MKHFFSSFLLLLFYSSRSFWLKAISLRTTIEAGVESLCLGSLSYFVCPTFSLISGHSFVDLCPVLRSVSCCTGRKGRFCIITLSDQIVDTLQATLLESGAEDSVERSARADLAVLRAAENLAALCSKERDGTEMAAAWCHCALHIDNGRSGHDGRGPRPGCNAAGD